MPGVGGCAASCVDVTVPTLDVQCQSDAVTLMRVVSTLAGNMGVFMVPFGRRHSCPADGALPPFFATRCDVGGWSLVMHIWMFPRVVSGIRASPHTGLHVAGALPLPPHILINTGNRAYFTSSRAQHIHLPMVISGQPFFPSHLSSCTAITHIVTFSLHFGLLSLPHLSFPSLARAPCPPFLSIHFPH